MNVSEQTLEDSATEHRSPQPSRFRALIARGAAVDALIAGVLAAMTFLVHSVGYALSAPFWVDESWVAVSTRLSLQSVRHVTSVTPLGWTFLMRTIVVGGEQRYRLLPMIFSALTVIAAYGLARVLPWRTPWWARLAATLAGIVVLLAPSSLLRNDLKPYTADAFLTLTVLFLLACLERAWSRKALALIGAACFVADLFSVVALFVAVSVFASIILGCVIRRNWRHAVEALVAALATGLGLGAVFVVLYAPHLHGQSLPAYWRHFYLPVDKGWGPSLNYLHTRGDQMASYLGMGPMILAIGLVLAGVLTLALSGRPALAGVAPILVIEMIVLGAAKKYPLFDLRTSHFLTVTFGVYAAIGVAGLCSLVARQRVLVGIVVAALAVVPFVINVRHDLRARSIPKEDVRTAVDYVASHRTQGDIIIVNSSANFAFSYYWPVGRPVWLPDAREATEFRTSLPDQPTIVFALDRTPGTVDAAIVRATTLARKTPEARIWLVRMHVDVPELQLWNRAISADRMQVTQIIPCSLLLLDPVASGIQMDHGLDAAPGPDPSARC